MEAYDSDIANILKYPNDRIFFHMIQNKESIKNTIIAILNNPDSLDKELETNRRIMSSFQKENL
ncbi:MAG: hypothetical protein GXP45_06030 [bacterium]|nr:hypothetical protein [bacterium]